MEISEKDVLWNYAATFLRIASSVLLLPIILKVMPSEMVGIWTVFITITAFSTLLDFGFSPSFTRTITYIFSGVKTLKRNGFESVEDSDVTIDYDLLGNTIKAMRWIYFRIALFLLILMSTIGTYYIHSLISSYSSNHTNVYIAWGILCLINTYNLYTFYYDSLLQGRGLIKKSKQIIIIGQLIYLLIATVFILLRFELVAIVLAQAASVVVIRLLSHRAFYTKKISSILEKADNKSYKVVLDTILPNAFKIGLTSFGSFLQQRSALLIGSLYLTLNQTASYAISMQLLYVLTSISAVFIATYQPKIVQLQVLNDTASIKKIYIRSQIIVLLTYIIGGFFILFLGDWTFNLIQSQTRLMTFKLLVFALIVSYEEIFLMVATAILLTKNEVPFYKSSIITGVLIIIGLFVSLNFFHTGIISMIMIPFIVNVSYQVWKWPSVVHKQLNINNKDILWGIKNLTKRIDYKHV